MSPTGRFAFGLFAFLPALGVTLIAGYLSSQVNADPFSDTKLFYDHHHLTGAAFFVGGGILAVALLQIILGAVVAFHCANRRDLSAGEKVGWSLACLFVGSIGLPLFFLMKSRPPPKRAI